MIKRSKISTSLFLFICCYHCVFAQSNGIVFDTIKIRKISNSELIFKVEDALLNKVSISDFHPVPIQIKGKHVFGDFGRGLLTMVSGIGVENTKNDIDLKITSNIRCKENKFNWKIHLYCKGTMFKDRVRNSNEDGGFSMSVDREAHIYWDKGIRGEIMKGDSKIGEFLLIKYTNLDAIMNQNPLEILQELKNNKLAQDAKLDANKAISTKSDFTILGEFGGKNFSVVSNVKLKRYSVFQDKNIKAILQLPFTNQGPEARNRIVLLQPNMTDWEATYWIRLALYNEYLLETLHKSHFSW